MKYEIKCPYCGNTQIYKPRNELPDIPHTKCKECKKEFAFKVNNPKNQIIEKVSKLPTSNQKGDTETRGRQPSTAPPYPIYKDVNIKDLIKNWSIDQLLNNYKHAAKAVDILSREDFLEQGEIISNIFWTSDTPPYKRPDFLFPAQVEAMELMDMGHLLWYASRQNIGKTTATLLKDVEDMLDTPDTVVGLIAPTVPLAVEQLFKFIYDPLKKVPGKPRFYDILKPYFLKDPNQLGFKLKNRSRLEIISLNIAGSQGRSLDIVHLEELDKLSQEQSKRQALAGIINSIRANPNAKIRSTSNQLTGIFRLLKQELFKYGMEFPIYVEDVFQPGNYTGRHTIVNKDVIPEEVPILDDFLNIFSTVLVSAAFAESQLYNIDDITDETFNPEMVEYAYKQEWDPSDYYVRTTMGIDPGGKVDAFGVTIWSLTKNGNIVQRWAKRYYNAAHSARGQAHELAEKYLSFNVEYIQVESSAGSPWSMSLLADEVWEQSGKKIRARYMYVNFEGEGKPFDKMNFVYMFKILLDFKKLILYERDREEQQLHFQITKYIPQKSESNNNPDDLVESAFHGIWILLGGMKYIQELIEMEGAPVGETI